MDHLCDLLAAAAEAVPDRVAVRVDGAGALTYAVWDAAANAAGRGLVEAGVAPGDAVLLLAGNGDADLYRAAYMATLRAGGVAVPVNPRVARRELEHMAADSGARVVVAGADQEDRAADLDRGRGGPVDGLVVVARRPAGPPPAPGPGPGPGLGPGPGPGPTTVDWDELCRGDGSAFGVAVGDDEVSDILYTSGTTGRPKGVAVTHRSVAGALSSSPLEPGQTLLHAAPVATFMATHGIQVLVVQYGLTEIVLPSFDAARFAELVGSERPGWLTMVPAHALLLLESGALAGVDTSSTRVVMFGGAPMPHEAVRGLAAAFPRAGLINGYGLTEGGTTVVAMPPGEAVRRPGAVGRPFDPSAVRIVDADGADVAPGAVGEVAIRVPPGQRRYHNDPEATAATWRGEWLLTGDLGRLDDEGYLHLVDRRKDLIVRGGYNISSIEVEGALHEHPDVLEAVVVGLPHPVLGQDLAAVVRVRPGTELDAAALGPFLADRLSDYKHPRRLVTTTEPLPRNPMGKLDKLEVRRRLGDPGASADGT